MKSSHLIEIQPERDVTGDNFSKGQINFNWTLDSTGYINPYKSFIKLRVKLLNGVGAPLVVSDNIAPNMFLADNLFQSMRMHLNNVCVSEIDDYCGQVSSLKQRMFCSEEHLNNYVAPTNFSQAYFKERQIEVVSDSSTITDRKANNVLKPRNVGTFEIIWKPCLAFYDVDEFIPGCQGLFNLQLTPQPNGIFQKCAIESLVDDKVPGTNFTFTIESMNMYIMKGIGPPYKDKSLKMDLKECRCQTQNLTTNSLHQKTFQVHKRCTELTLAYQQSGASITDTRYSATKLKAENTNELKIRRFWINYGGKQLPTPIPDPEFDVTTRKDFLTQRYVESLMYSNSLYSPEPLNKWLERGWYAHFSGYSPEEREDRVFVSSQFDTFEGANPNVLLFDWYSKRVIIIIEGSRVQDVQVH